MDISFIYSGVGGAVLGALVSSWVTVRLNHSYQRKLLQQQLDFQQRLLDQQLAAEDKSHKEHLKFLEKSDLGSATGGLTLRTVLHNEFQELIAAIKERRQ